MALIDILADVSGLRRAIDDNTSELRRIAEAMERAFPPLRSPLVGVPLGGSPGGSVGSASDEPEGFHIAESPEEYQERMSEEASLAISLGVAPWSPAFEKAVSEMRADLMKPRMEVDEEGKIFRREPLTKDQANEHIKDAFRLARAEANTIYAPKP